MTEPADGDDYLVAMEVAETLANPDTGEVALLCPGGSGEDPHPWLVITPALCDGGVEGHDWVADEYVRGWLRVNHGGVP